MEKFSSILIRYNNSERLTFLTYAEFLRLAGIYVCEEIINSETQIDENTLRREDFSVVYRIPKGRSNNDLDNVLCEFLEELNLNECVRNSQEWMSCYERIKSIYVEHNLMRASVMLQYFRMNGAPIEKAGAVFKKAADAFDKIYNNMPEEKNRYVAYAKLYCKQKANLARYYCESSLIYYVDHLAEEGFELIEKFKDFSNAWILLGLVYDISKDFGRETIDAFEKAVIMLNNKQYAASVYYFLGKKCEGYDSFKELSRKAYRASYNLLPNYRNAYKIAWFYMIQQQWDKALEYFGKVLVLLEKRLDFRDPLEHEYYFKTNIHKAFIYLQLKEYHEVLNCVGKSLELRQQLENDDIKYIKFYKDLGDDYFRYEDIKELELVRMGVKQANLYMATAWQELDEPNKADKYWKQVRV